MLSGLKLEINQSFLLIHIVYVYTFGWALNLPGNRGFLSNRLLLHFAEQGLRQEGGREKLTKHNQLWTGAEDAEAIFVIIFQTLGFLFWVTEDNTAGPCGSTKTPQA